LTPARTIVLSEVANKPAAKIRVYQPLADYLASHLSEWGVEVGEVKIAPDLETAARMVREGEVDLYFDSPYPAMMVGELSGAQPILRRWKGGEAEYWSVLFARLDSGITSLGDLRGRMIGAENTYSTSGYLLPLAHLLESGLSTVEKPDPQAPVSSQEVGYVFTGDEKNTIQWVLSNRVVAGGVDNRNFLRIPDEERAELHVLAETEKAARALVMAPPGMDPAFLQAVKNVLLDMENSPEGASILVSFEATARFDEFPSQAALDRMRELFGMMLAPR
jgi:phosphonate transport system substrate-binding protein